MNAFTILAITLLIIWIVVRFVLALTSAVLNLVWIAALVLIAIGIWKAIKR